MTNLREVLALNIRKKRHDLGFSQAKLAEKANTAPTYIAMIELEKKFPSVEMLERIAAALELDTLELFSIQSFPEESLKKLHEQVLTDFERVITEHLKNIKKKS